MGDGAYSIVDWRDRYENCRTREVKRMNWVSLPVALDGDAFGFLMARPNGMRNYGLYIALVQIAANMPVRGTLEDAKGVLTAKRLAVMLRSPEAEVAEGLEILSDPEVGLISRRCTTLHDIARPDRDDARLDRDASRHCTDSPVCMSVLPVCSSPETNPPEQGAVKETFEKFWNAYPSEKAHARTQCWTKWCLDGLSGSADQIISGLERWKRSDGWRDSGGKYIPNALKFLEERRWENAPAPKGSVRPPNATEVCAWWQSLTADQKAPIAARGVFTVDQVDGYIRHKSPPDYITEAWKGVARAG